MSESAGLEGRAGVGGSGVGRSGVGKPKIGRVGVARVSSEVVVFFGRMHFYVVISISIQYA